MDFGWFLVKPWFFQPLQPYAVDRERILNADKSRFYIKENFY
jgi:hypothetical protein